MFDGLAGMIAEGSFPFERSEVELEEAPRVGDGVIVLDEDRRVRFASPNAVSSLHRMGIHAYTHRARSSARSGSTRRPVDAMYRAQVPVIGRDASGATSSVLVHGAPVARGRHASSAGSCCSATSPTSAAATGCSLSKDATIREIHHRVKNNLQTIAALLRLQARRLQSPEARAALEESERRIRSIAIVHETLSRDASDVVPFDEIVRPLARLVEETRRPVPSSRSASGSRATSATLPGEVATPLAVVLNELMQNAVDHAFPAGEVRGVEGRVRVLLARDGDDVVVEVVDDGVGLPAGFDLEGSSGLGLSIVHTLVTSELGGSIELRDDGRSAVRVPVRVARAPDQLERARLRRRSQAVARCWATQPLRSLRRSSSVVPPQMPASWFVARANSRHSPGYRGRPCRCAGRSRSARGRCR